MTSESSEPVVPTPDESANGENSTAPTLNRAERRAQAKGKKGGANSGNSMGGFHNGNAMGGNRPSVVPSKSRFPRTGHK